mgnify:CR=1 FL=1
MKINKEKIKQFEVVPNNFFLILVAAIIVIVVGISTWSTACAVFTILVEIFMWVWYVIIFHHNKAKQKNNGSTI